MTQPPSHPPEQPSHLTSELSSEPASEPAFDASSAQMPPAAAGRQLLFFGEDWGRHPSTAQYLARELLADHNVTWINSIGLREPSLSLSDLQRVTGKLQRALAGSADAPGADPTSTSADRAETEVPATAAAPQQQLSPWILPWHRVGLAQALNRALFKRQLASQPQLGAAPYSVITANPASYYLLDTLQDTCAPISSLYYCADKYAQIAGLDPVLVERFERELLERVDAVAATSLPLVDDLSKHHKNVHYLPHGVDFARFNSALDITSAAEANAHPVVGFVGLLGEHIDFELIAACASALPEVEFLYVGPHEQGVILPEAANITYTGQVPQEALPAQLARMHICTLPYAMTERNHYANPTKVREYLAAGRCVVATRQPGLADIDGEVTVADSAGAFIAALKAQLAELKRCDATTLAARRSAIAATMTHETWAARAQALLALL